MWKNAIRPGTYIGLVVALLVLMLEYKTRFLFAIARPIFHDYDFYSYFVAFWFVTTLLYLIPRRTAFYAFIPANTALLANSYFVLILRLYFFAFRLDDIALFIALTLIIGINLLMWLKRTAARDAVLVNLLTLLSSLPLALQQAIIMPYDGPLE